MISTPLSYLGFFIGSRSKKESVIRFPDCNCGEGLKSRFGSLKKWSKSITDGSTLSVVSFFMDFVNEKSNFDEISLKRNDALEPLLSAVDAVEKSDVDMVESDREIVSKVDFVSPLVSMMVVSVLVTEVSMSVVTSWSDAVVPS